jgi:catechol 2,3-dioxygenase-like lactoylglutathione lyase family enzyme
MPGIGVKTLDHVTLVVRDLGESRQFYVGLLGMEEVPRPDFTFQGAWFQAGNTWIHLILEHDESGDSGNRVGSHLSASRTHHFAFRVEDAFQAAEILRRAGYPIASGPKERPDGAIQVFVFDPDGYVVELSSPPKT